MILDTVDVKKKGVHTRYLILLIIFIVTAVNYADRATLSIAGTEVAKELQLSAVSMGYIFSAFGWAYLLMQIPGGWLLDKFGSKKFTPTASFSGRCSLSCKALLICSRWPGQGSPCSLCALCSASRKRHHSRRTPVLSPPGFRQKNVVLPPPSLTRRNISRWRSFRRCLAG